MISNLTNRDIAKVLYEVAVYLEMQDVAFKPRAYEKVAETIEALDQEVGDMYKAGSVKAFEKIPGVGASIAEKLEELVKTGRLKYYEQLKKEMPVDLSGLTAIEGIGPKAVKTLWEKLRIKTVADLERAARAGKVRKLAHFGERSEQKVLEGIEFLKQSSGRFPLGHVLPLVRSVAERLTSATGVERVMITGSIRRWKETVGDADILVISKKSKPVMDYFVGMPEVAAVHAHGETKSSVRLKNGMDVDVRVVPKKSFGAALNYFTGSKDHNVALRKIAVRKGWKLNEYGLFAQKGRTERLIAGASEEEVYEKLGLAYIEPEMRENTGEIELSAKNNLPKLIGYNDLKGDLQTQTDWTDGTDSIEMMAREAARLGHEYIAITDHTKALAMTHGSDEKKLLKQMEEIEKVNKRLCVLSFRLQVLKGAEVDILKDGLLDIEDRVLAKLDVVGVAVHSYFNLPRAEQTKRIIHAMENPHVDILFHPTGRIVGKREPYDVDIDEIIRAARRTGTVLEVNASDRLDLKDEYIHKAVGAGVKLAISTDAHATAHLAWLEFGIGQARRGWAKKSDVINTMPLKDLLAFFKLPKQKRR